MRLNESAVCTCPVPNFKGKLCKSCHSYRIRDYRRRVKLGEPMQKRTKRIIQHGDVK